MSKQIKDMMSCHTIIYSIGIIESFCSFPQAQLLLSCLLPGARIFGNRDFDVPDGDHEPEPEPQPDLDEDESTTTDTGDQKICGR